MRSLRPALIPSPCSRARRCSFFPSISGTVPGAALLLLPTNMSALGDGSPANWATESPQAGADRASDNTVVQYVVLRRDIVNAWPTGSVVAQGCHAAVAAVWAHRSHPDVIAYCSDSNLDTMHKVLLEVKGEAEIRKLSGKLTECGIDHKLWIEQPENTATCVATRPYPKSQVASFFKKLKLCK